MSGKKVIPMIAQHLHDLRGMLGVRLSDLTYLFGTQALRLRAKGPESLKPISKPATSIMLRYLTHYPDDSPIPKTPNTEEVYQLMVKHFPYPAFGIKEDEDLTWGMFSTILGNTQWVGYEWQQGKMPNSTMQRLLLIIKNVILSRGTEGLTEFLDIVDEDARAHGFLGLENVLENAGWDVRRRNDPNKKPKPKKTGKPRGRPPKKTLQK